MADLERELEEQDGMRSKLQEVFEAGTAGLVRQSGEASHMEGLEESAAREERRRQEQVLGTSSSWDLAVRRLEKSVEGVSRTFKEGNGMLAVAPLTALKAAEENLDSELKALMVKQFGSEDNGEKRENSIGRNQDYSSLSRELARLRASLFQAEWQRIFQALPVNHVVPEREHILAPSAGYMMKILALKEMHVVVTKFLLLLLLIVIVDQVSCTGRRL